MEVKSTHVDCPWRLYDTLSSFSNQDSGGILLFGVDEAAGFQVVGVYDPQDLQKKIMEQCNQMEPPVRTVLTLAEWTEGSWVCSAEIPALNLSERPCYYKGAGRTRPAGLLPDAALPAGDCRLSGGQDGLLRHAALCEAPAGLRRFDADHPGKAPEPEPALCRVRRVCPAGREIG